MAVKGNYEPKVGGIMVYSFSLKGLSYLPIYSTIMQIKLGFEDTCKILCQNWGKVDLKGNYSRIAIAQMIFTIGSIVFQMTFILVTNECDDCILYFSFLRNILEYTFMIVLNMVAPQIWVKSPGSNLDGRGTFSSWLAA